MLIQSHGQHRPYLIANQQLTITAARAELVAGVADFIGLFDDFHIRSAQLWHTLSIFQMEAPPSWPFAKISSMLTFKQWCVSKRKITQAQRAQIPDIERAKRLVMQAVEEALALRCAVPEGLFEEDLDRIFNHQPVHFDGLGYVPHWFQRQDIKWWGKQLCHYQQVGAKAAKKAQHTGEQKDDQ